MRIVFMGTPNFAVPSLEGLAGDGYEIAAVVTQPDRPAGRDRSLIYSPVKQSALKLGLPVAQPASLKSPEAIAQVAGFRPDVIIVAAFGQILPKALLSLPERGCINVHPSLLPKFRGASPVAAAILAGQESTGVSIILMDEGLDIGPILARVSDIPISPQDNTGTLTGELSCAGARLLRETLPRWVRGEITPQPQKDAEATYSRQLTKEDGRIVWHLGAEIIWRSVRAFTPWPGCYTEWQGKQLKILEAVPLPGKMDCCPGQVIAVDKKEAPFGVGTGDGILGVLKLQVEGKKAMTAAEFLRGQRGFIGAVLSTG